MKLIDDSGLRSILSVYKVCDPPDDLVGRTKLLMCNEIVLSAEAPACQYRWAMALTGLAFVLILNLFYILTVGTVLRMTLSTEFAGILEHMTVAFSVAEGCLLAVTIMVFYFKQMQKSLVRHDARYI